MKRTRKTTSLSSDAFLEAVLDSGGLEDGVLVALEVKARVLHQFLEHHPELREAALSELEERELDVSESRFGWLRPSIKTKPETEEDSNWAQYRALLEEEPKLEAVASLEQAKARTNDLVSRLQSEKRAKLEEKRAKTVPWEWD